MANVVKKHSISSELAQKMVDEAVEKAGEIGVSENVAILDDGGNLKAFSRMDGAPILSIEIAQNKAYTQFTGFPRPKGCGLIEARPTVNTGNDVPGFPHPNGCDLIESNDRALDSV
jgi:uncharacterized protein GlcG (DUF336 family)